MADTKLTRMHDVLVMVLIDGKVTDQEKQYIEAVRDRLSISADQFRKLVKEVQDGSRQIILPASPIESEEVLRDMIGACLADGKLDVPERKALDKIAEHMHLSTAALDSMLDEATGVDERQLEDKVEAMYLGFAKWDQAERQKCFAELINYGRAAVTHLLRMLESYRTPDGAPDALELKILIVDALAQLGDRRAVYYLVTQVQLSGESEVTNDDLRAAAAAAVGKIVGEPFTRDVAGVNAVKQWWMLAGVRQYDTLAI